MFNISLRRFRASSDQGGAAAPLVRVLDQMSAPLRRAASGFVQYAKAGLHAAVTRLASSGRATPRPELPADRRAPSSIKRDWLRQALNLLLSITQFAAAALIFSSQFGDDLFRNPDRREPPIVPADYTFGIWAFIFPASIAYGVYQALPHQRTNDLLRRIGFQSAFAFGCITLWSVATLFDPIRYTVPLFFGALWGLISALYQISRAQRLTTAEQLLVSLPLGVYAAWCTVGTIANTSTSLAALGYTELGAGEQAWAVIMLLAAGLISSLMISASRGNLAYAAGILWALIGIVVANVSQRPNGTVALTALTMAALVGSALVRAHRMTTQRDTPIGT